MNFIKMISENSDHYVNLDNTNVMKFEKETETLAIEFINGHQRLYNNINQELMKMIEERIKSYPE